MAEKRFKNKLPPPYKPYMKEIHDLQANRDFVYGKDEKIEFSERDCRVQAPCTGVLYFRCIELLELVVEKRSFNETVPISYYLKVDINDMQRSFKIVHSLDSNQVRIDSGIHLPIDLSEYRNAPTNMLRLSVWSFQDPEVLFIVGTAEIHVYNFIRVQHTIQYADLWSDGIRVGKLAYEAAFSYGTYGYGHSNQLKNTSQPIMETISHSMFPRITPDESDICDKTFQARKPDNLKMFSDNSFIREVDDLGDPQIPGFSLLRPKSGIKLEPKPLIASQVEFVDGFPVHCKMNMNIYQRVIQADFNDMMGEYICLTNRKDRLKFYDRMLQGRKDDMYQNITSPLFEHLEDAELDQIVRPPKTVLEGGEGSDDELDEIDRQSKTVLGESSDRRNCGSSTTTKPVTKLPLEEQKFQDEFFPSVRREGGFLNKMFGYEKKSDPEKALNDMDAPLYKQAKARAPQVKNVVTKENCWSLFWDWLKRTVMFAGACWYRIWYFVPDVREQEPEVPQISVTLASPEGSTTAIQARFEEKKDSANWIRKQWSEPDEPSTSGAEDE